MQAKKVGKVTAKVIHATLDHHLANGTNMDLSGPAPGGRADAREGDV